jgi:protein-disulfide isomerase
MNPRPCLGLTLLTHIVSALAFLCVCGLCVIAQDIKPGADSPFTKGNQNAEYKIEVFNDYQCSACATFDKTLRRLQKKFPDKILITFRNFPLEIHRNARPAAKAIEAAGKQGKFLEMMGLIYARREAWAEADDTRNIFLGFAKRLNLDQNRFSKHLDDPEIAERIEKDIERARSLRLDSTPSVFLNGKVLSLAEAGELDRLISTGQ